MSNHPSKSTTLSLYLMIVLYGWSSVHCSVVSTSCSVGQDAVLPCLVSSLDQSEPSPYIQWLSMSETVFERMGMERFQGQGYEGRADVPQQMLKQGNCSLFLRDVRLMDSGAYQSYLVTGKTNLKTKVLLQSVQLIVRDYKLKQRVEIEKDLVLELHTPQARQLVHQSGQPSEWVVLWMKGGEPHLNPRVREEVGRVILQNVSRGDEGTYRVLDEHGLALSTVIVKVTEPSPGETEPALHERQFSVDYSAASRLSCPALCLLLPTALIHYFI